MTSPLTHHATTHTTPDPQAPEDLDRQQAAIAALGHELRALVEATVRTTASPATLHQVADDVRSLTRQLTGRHGAPGEIPGVDEFPGGVRMYSPVTGSGSPLAPPLHVTSANDGVAGTCTLGIAASHERDVHQVRSSGRQRLTARVVLTSGHAAGPATFPSSAFAAGEDRCGTGCRRTC
ncbi:hypothetical protein ABZ478_38245 [Streptomyces sp. NPDC005706]|uniref:hypothetical protein n=1 Tax=Streptomyces sp. NPDC005706 TaxID=3157169 RepID=UPI003408BA1C